MNDKEMNPFNLTPEQIEMLAMMLSITDYEGYQQWIDNISYEEAEMAEQLQRMIIREMGHVLIEEEDIDTTEAKEYLKKFRLK